MNRQISRFAPQSAALSVLCVVSLLISGGFVSPANTQTGKAVSVPAHRFVPGERLVYHVSYAGDSRADLRSLLAESGKTMPAAGVSTLELKSRVQTEMVLTPLKPTADGTLVRIQLRRTQAHLEANGERSDVQDARLRDDMEHALYAVLDRQGRLRSYRIEGVIGQTARGHLCLLLGYAQCVLPSGNAALPKSWTTNEETAEGKYEARYTVQAASSGVLTLSRQKIRYAAAPSAPALLPTGSFRIVFDTRRGRLLNVEGTESLKTVFRGQAAGQSRNQVTFALLRTEPVAEAEQQALLQKAGTLAKNTPARSLSAPPTEAENELTVARTMLGQTTLADLLRELQAAEKAAPGANLTTLQRKLKAMVFLNPASCPVLGARLTNASASSQTFALLSAAFSEAGTPAAQQALAETVRQHASETPALQRLLLDLSLVKRPTQETEQTLRTLLAQTRNPDVAAMCSLALGSLAKTLAPSAPVRTANIVALLQTRLQKAQTLPEQRYLLGALGNTGSRQAYPTLSHYTRHSAPELRSAALAALRWLPDSRVENVLARALTGDKDSRVRQEAAFALSFRRVTAPLFQTQKQAFYREKEPVVRQALLGNLWNVRKTFPAVRQMVQETALWDDTKEVREAAVKLLAEARQGDSH